MLYLPRTANFSSSFLFRFNAPPLEFLPNPWLSASYPLGAEPSTLVSHSTQLSLVRQNCKDQWPVDGIGIHGYFAARTNDEAWGCAKGVYWKSEFECNICRVSLLFSLINVCHITNGSFISAPQNILFCFLYFSLFNVFSTLVRFKLDMLLFSQINCLLKSCSFTVKLESR